MSLQAEIEASLLETLSPERMQLVNESHQHSGPGSETHFNLIIVADAFDGQNRVQRQRTVFRALEGPLKAGVHALTMKTLTPAEWEAAGGEVENPQWTALWKGKTVRDASGKLAITVKKGVVDNNVPREKAHYVDGLAGATITSKGVQTFVRADLTAFEAYLNKSN